MTEEYRDALEPGSDIQGYRIERVLGAGGFSVTYLAREAGVGEPVVVKEYLPSGLAMRASDGTIVALSEDDREDFDWGMARFADEAFALVSVPHPNVVSVLRFFRGNGTMYMVLGYCAGEDLARVLARRKTLEEAALLALVGPLLDGLAEVHRRGYLHRDVKPSNIFVQRDGVPVLLDFGAARQALGQRSRRLTAVVSPGYAPFEQYGESGRPGPWSDIYAVGGVMYRCLTGKAPPAAPDRKRQDQMVPALEAGRDRYSVHVLAAIDRALSVDERDRPQHVAEFRRLLHAGPVAPRASIGGSTIRLSAMHRGDEIS